MWQLGSSAVPISLSSVSQISQDSDQTGKQASHVLYPWGHKISHCNQHFLSTWRSLLTPELIGFGRSWWIQSFRSPCTGLLLVMTCSACFLMESRTTSLGLTPLMVGWALPHQLLVKAMLYSLAYRPVLWRHCSQIGVIDLCQFLILHRNKQNHSFFFLVWCDIKWSNVLKLQLIP